MLKSSNLDSIINAVEAEIQQSNNADELPSPLCNRLNAVLTPVDSSTVDVCAKNKNECTTNKDCQDHHDTPTTTTSNANNQQTADSLATKQLTTGVLQIFEPPLTKARSQLKELIGKQNKIYIDLSAEKYKLDNAETTKLHEMMNNVKIYREKLIKIKKQMQNIYQRTKGLKKRALNVQTCKQRELQRKIQKQQQEEALIAKQQQTQAQT